jgi:hypothetical protein
MKRLLISMTILALLVVPQFASGGDVDDLKATVAKIIQAQDALDAEAVASIVYPGGVNYARDAAFPYVAPMENTQAVVTELLKMEFDSLEFISVNTYNMQYRVVGNTGIVWGHSSASYKIKGEPIKTTHQRGTSTWVKSDGKWHMIMNHVSAIPPGD